MNLQVARSQGFSNRDVRPDNMLVHGDIAVIYRVDWGSAVRRFGTALPCDGTVHFIGSTHFGSATACQQPSCRLIQPQMI